MAYEAIIFDMDGVLVERTPSHVFDTSVDAAFDAYGVTEPESEDYKLLRDSPRELSAHADRFNKRYGIDVGKLWKKRQEHTLRGTLDAMRNGKKNVYDDVEAINSLQRQLAVVSNNQSGAVDKILHYYGIDDRVETWSGIAPRIEELRHRKPNPKNIIETLDQLDAKMGLYVGDKEKDLLAAENAGVDSAIIRREFNAEQSFDVRPTYDLDSLEELIKIAETGRPSDSDRSSKPH